MKITLRLIVSMLIATAVVVLLFSYVQTQVEERKLSEDLSLRSRLVAKSFKEAIEPFLAQTEHPGRIRQFIEKFKGHTRLVGIFVKLKEGELIAYPDWAGEQAASLKELDQLDQSEQVIEKREKWDGKDVLIFALPIEKDGAVVGALGVVHDRTYITRRITESWKRLALTFSILALILSVTTLVIIRWSVTGPIAKIADWAKKARLGDVGSPPLKSFPEKGDIERLVFEMMHMASRLKATRLDLIEQSRSKQFLDSIWTPQRLKEYLNTKVGETPLFVVANREPYIHRRKGAEVECIVPASGVVTALDPVLQATGGVWIAHGSGDADREAVHSQDKLIVPPWRPNYSLRRIWLSEEEEKGYYYGFSNEGLWPLCHIAHVRPVFRVQDWESYQQVNEKFAQALLEELPKYPSLVLVQDYHFALLPKLVKERRPDVKVALFWHIPWPNPEAFGICPWQEEILDGMLGSDVIGFHTQFHCNNFLDTVDRVLESKIDWTVFGVTRGGKTTYVRPFPISIAYPPDNASEDGARDDRETRKRALGLEGKLVGVGVDRLDYTKGLMERFAAVERFLEKYPHYKGRLVFVELAAPSRSTIPSYQNHAQEIDACVQRINAKFSQDGYQPIQFLKDHHGQEKIKRYYQAADFCLVSSLHDGMNLVAKEFVASRDDEMGVLILSRFTGASQEFQSALLINPYHVEEVADVIHQALTMLPEEQKERMKRLRSLLAEHNVYRWAAELVTELVKSF